jgi:hypothetical protein
LDGFERQRCNEEFGNRSEVEGRVHVDGPLQIVFTRNAVRGFEDGLPAVLDACDSGGELLAAGFAHDAVDALERGINR